MRSIATGALLLDILAGEPGNRIHPTVWMGRFLGARRNARISRDDIPSFVEGLMALGVGVGLTVVAASTLERSLDRLPRGLRSGAKSVALKPAFSLRALISAARSVRRALEQGEIARARGLLGMHLVSRDTSLLDEHEIAGAAIESVAENFSDSVVAPLLAHRVGGLAGAYAYRFVNTADAMLGYRTTELEWFGKAAARTDDALNFVPARLAALLICLCAVSGNGSVRDAMRCTMRDARRTASPNAGWPMSAMAGALDVTLTKRECYALNSGAYLPMAEDIERCCRIVIAASILCSALIDFS